MADSLDILVVSQFFSPEMGAPAARFHDFGRLLIERGHRVSVVTGIPNFPSGVVPPEHRGYLRRVEEIDGIRIHRGWMYASHRLGKATKAFGYASYAASASLWALAGRLRADVVIATSPPPTVAIPGMLAAWRLRAPLVFDVRDIWPEAVIESGRLRSRLAVRPLEAVERAVYRASAAVTVVTDGKRARLIEKGVDPAKIAVIPNGVDLARFEHEVPVDNLFDTHDVDRRRLLVIYAGIFGPSQGLDVLLDAALLLRESEEGARVQFVLVGSGVERPRIETRVDAEQLGDLVRLLPEQPRERIPSLLRAAHAVAVTLRPRRDTHTLPSKIYESLASGKPVLVSADGAPADILNQSGAGFATAAGDARALAESIRKLLEAPDRGRALGERGRRYAAAFDRRALVERFEELLRDVAGREPGVVARTALR